MASTLEQWQRELLRARDTFQQSVENNFPGKWLATEACVSVYAQLFIEDVTQPLALLLLGQPSGKKTAVLSFFDKLPHSYHSDKFTPKSFVSHNAAMKSQNLLGIDLLPKIRAKCFITPELAPLFGAREDELLDSLSTMTRILDGQGFTSDSGVHGRRGYTDPIMFVWLGAIVDIPRKVWRIQGHLGSRLYFLRIEAENTDEEKGIANLLERSHMEKLQECQTNAKRYMRLLDGRMKWDKAGDSRDVVRIIYRMAKLLAHLRAVATVWDTAGTGGSDYGFSTPVIESPDRAANALYNLARGHTLSCGRKQIWYDDLRVVIEVALSSASLERTTLLDMLLKKNGFCATDDFMAELKCSRATALKTMRELEIIGLVSIEDVGTTTKPKKAARLNNEFNWFLSQDFKDFRTGQVKII